MSAIEKYHCFSLLLEWAILNVNSASCKCHSYFNCYFKARQEDTIEISAGKKLTYMETIGILPRYNTTCKIQSTVADSGGVRGVQMHPPLAASNVFLRK